MGELIQLAEMRGGEMSRKNCGMFACIWNFFVDSTAGQRTHRWSLFFKRHRGGAHYI